MMLGTYDKALEDAQTAIKLDENFLKVSLISRRQSGQAPSGFEP